jgi:hypothetical protein
MAKRIVAVAIGNPANSVSINAGGPTGVRKYINGLIDYLTGNGYNIGQYYYIDYYECYEGDVDFPRMVSEAPTTVIVCMSTPIVKYARDFTKPMANPIPIVGVFSDRVGEQFDKCPNICGVNAQRIQFGWNYYDTFVTNYKQLKYVYVLNHPGSAAAKGALSNIKTHTPPPSKPLIELDVTSNPGQGILDLVPLVPPGSGLLVLPVDLFFASSDAINNSVQPGVKVFWPAKEFTKPPNDKTLYFGASQYSCGMAMGKQVQYVFDNNQIPTGTAQYVNVNPD